MQGVFLSIAISTWNNCEELDRTLSSLGECRLPEGLSWELIVVNNNCADATDQIVKMHQTALPIVPVYEPRQGLSYGKNAALERATGQWILFTDDDVRPHRDWIIEYVEAFNTNPIGFFFGGPVTSIFTAEPPCAELLSVATKAIRGFSLQHDFPSETESSFLSANWAASAEDLRKQGGFDVELGLNPARKDMRFGEETDLQVRLRAAGRKAVYLPRAEVGHIIPAQKSTPEYILSRAEASSLDRARRDKFNLLHLCRLQLSLTFYYILFLWDSLRGRKGYFRQYQWRVRRGKVRHQLHELFGMICRRAGRKQ